MRLALTLVLALFSATACVIQEDSTDDPGPADPNDPNDPNDPGEPNPACASFAGTWLLTGACGFDTCTVTQVGCAISSVRCESGGESTSGTITGNAFSYQGTTSNGDPTSCSGTVDGANASGTCTTLSVPCDFAADRL